MPAIPTMTHMSESSLDRIAADLRGRDLFDEIRGDAAGLECRARDAAAEAWYRLFREGSQWIVSLVTADRWLSESIESDLMHHGDPIEELVGEELVELGVETGSNPPRVPVRHFRSDDLLYTFETPVPGDSEATVLRYLLAYEAAFRPLGDMSGGDED
jgi:hypothetical protein